LLAFFASFWRLLVLLLLERRCAKLLALELTDAFVLLDNSEGGSSGEIFLLMGFVVFVL